LKQEADIVARISDLRDVLRDIRSEDLRQTVEAAIGDCEQQLAALAAASRGTERLDAEAAM
jgi:hypothetical protein